MTTTQTLIALVKSQCSPQGEPQDAAYGLAADFSITNWLKDACAKVAARRGLNTALEFRLDEITDVSAYNLPDGCIGVQEIIPVAESSVGSWGIVGDMGVPFPTLNLPYSPQYLLPTGQAANASVQLIQAQNARLSDREYTWHLQGEQIVLDFPTITGRSIVVRFWAEDRDPENLPERYWDLAVTYVKLKLTETQRLRLLTVPDAVADGQKANTVGLLTQAIAMLKTTWEDGLGSITASERA